MPVGKSGNSGAGGKPGSRPGSRPSGDAGPSTVSGNGDGGRSEAGPGSGASSPDKRASSSISIYLFDLCVATNYRQKVAYIRRIATQRVSVAENDAFRSRILNDDDFRKLVVQQQELYESRSEHIKARRLKSILGHCDFLRENLPQNPDPRTMMLNELRRGFARLGTSPTQNSRTIAGEESEQLDVIWLVAGDDASPAQARSFDRQFKENLDFQDLASEAQFTLVWKSECEDLVRLGLAMAKSHGLGSQSVILPEHFREGIIEAGVQGVYVATERQGPSSPRTHTRAQTGADSATQPRFSLIGTAPRNAAAHAPQATDRFQRTLAGTIRAIAAARRASSVSTPWAVAAYQKEAPTDNT